MSDSLEAIFQAKYDEFAAALTDVFPELTENIKLALEIGAADRVKMYKTLVMPTAGNPKRDPSVFPGMVLPGVFINEAAWNSATEGTRKAINQFLSLMTFSFLMREGGSGVEGGLGGDEDAFKAWADKFMNEWRSKMDRTDFKAFADRFKDMFGGGGAGMDRLPPFPEKFKNGRLAKLAEDIVKELKPEEFGLDAETMKQCETDPSRAFEILMQSTMRNPGVIQNAMKRIVKKLQDKFQRGEFNPKDLAAEAEEMMKEFSENPAFVDMMESLRKTFNFEDPEAAAAAGKPESARLALVKARLRQKQAAKAAATAATGATTGAATGAAAMPAAFEQSIASMVNSIVSGEDDFGSILTNNTSNKKAEKKKGKK
jgi:hypothetical protein